MNTLVASAPQTGLGPRYLEELVECVSENGGSPSDEPRGREKGSVIFSGAPDSGTTWNMYGRDWSAACHLNLRDAGLLLPLFCPHGPEHPLS